MHRFSHAQRLASIVALCVLTVALCLPATGCQRSTEVLPQNAQTFQLQGKVMALSPQTGEVTIQHDAIPGFMDAMTMPYKVAHSEILSGLHVGDVIRARLTVLKLPDGDFRNPRLDEVAVLAQARPSYKPESNYNVPTPGEAVPDFAMTNQDGKVVRLAQFRGKAVLVTFIYTRCPMDDFCPKMSRNFAAIQKTLAADAKLQDGTQLLSISFDPAYDSPAVLRAYGASYTGGGFAHWQFAAPSKTDLPEVERFFNLGATPGDNNTITHSLSTVLIDPAGKIAAWYPGSEWSPAEVVAKMKAVAGS